MKRERDLAVLLREVRACRYCEGCLPFDPRPVLQCSPNAGILIAGQAPGRRVHESGLPFDDPSGERLRAWMGVTAEQFYDSSRVAILPMAFCYPGSSDNGDRPPPRICASSWRDALLGHMNRIRLTLVIGRYAQAYHFGSDRLTLTGRVSAWRDYCPDMLPLPHPSPRNNRWLKRNPWFETELLPELRARVSEILRNT